MGGGTGFRGSRVPGAALRAAERGFDVVTAVRDTAAEALRTRRDPVLVAERRQVAARRRLAAWSLVGLVLTAFGTVEMLDVLRGRVDVMIIGGLVLVVGLWVYCVVGVVQAARDLRVRTAAVRQLPPAQPRRRAVSGALRPVMARLDAYSDALRNGIGTIGVEVGGAAAAARRRPGSAAPARAAGVAGGTLREVRDETLAAADAAEVRLRQRAAELTAMVRAAGHGADPRLASACAELRREIDAGVDAYGRLVVAAADAAAASRQVTAAAGAGDGMPQATERLTALAAGMRELIGPAHTAG